MRSARVIDWFCTYCFSTNGPDPITPSLHFCCGDFFTLADDSMPSEWVEVACRNCALGSLKVTLTVSGSTTVVLLTLLG